MRCCWPGTSICINFLLLSTPESMTVAVALAQFLNSDESPWNFMMATAIIYALPPIIAVLRLPPLHGGGSDHGWRERLSEASQRRTLPSMV